MKKLTILLNLISLNILHSQTFINDPCFTLIFNDNFNSLNTSNWTIQDRISFTDPNTWDLPANVSVPLNSGTLRIKLDKQTHNGREYCGGEIISNASYTPGIYIESRAKNASGNGFSDAVWLFGGLFDNGTCNCSCGYCDPDPTPPDNSRYKCGCQNYNEIDFLEYFGTNVNISSRNRIYCTQNGQCVVGLQNDFNYGNNNPEDWHTYGSYWNNGKTSFHYDDKLTFTGNTVSTNPMAIDIDLWANPDASKNTFPKYFYVDYVRVFRINRSNNQCSVAVNNPANMIGYTYNLKKSIKLNTTSISKNIRHSFWATDFIELGGGSSNFDIPVSTQEITFGIGECW